MSQGHALAAHGDFIGWSSRRLGLWFRVWGYRGFGFGVYLGLGYSIFGIRVIGFRVVSGFGLRIQALRPQPGRANS